MRCKLPEKPMVKHKKGLWSPDEDKKLTYYVMNYGHSCWSSVPINAGLQRNGKSCRLRWMNYLRPGLKRGPFSSQEEETILTLHGLLGNKWSWISQHLSGRTDNEIKNYWHSHLKKKADRSKIVQVHLKLDNCRPSNMASKEPSSADLNASNSSSADMVQSFTPFSNINNSPKLLFADWINLDEFQHDFVMSSISEPKWQHNKGSTESGKYQNCLEMGSNENVHHTDHLTIDQIFEFIDGDFDIENLMYI